MQLTHTFTVPAPVDRVWETFTDLEQVGGCFPGATITEADGDAFSGSVKVKLGPIALVYNGSGRFVERDDQAHTARIEAKGKDKRGNGTAGADVNVTLTPDGDGTRAEVVTDLAITGKPAQFGRGVMQDVSDKLLQQFVSCIEQRLADSGAASDSGAGEAAGGAGGDRSTTGATGTAAAGSTGGAATATAGSSGAGGTASVADAADDGSSTPADAARAAAAATAAGERAPAAAAPRATPPPPKHAAPPADDAIDLGNVALPIMLRQLAPYVIGGSLGMLAAAAFLRRRGRRHGGH
ncbi:SRPBCC family protein [Barrientosiimonas humi]|uniref:SRPBCC family protein n=1 Tax=Barrientosiimonas humi TaxID=999931 RepID=UPI00370D6E68